MKPDCIHCSRHLRLVSEDNYSWRCEAGCAERIDTGIPTSTSITSFQRYAIHNGGLDISRVIRPLLPEYVSGARVYMPQIIYHFIECTWGGCYNHLYLNCIAPYLDSPCDRRLRSAQPGRLRICRRNTWLDRRTHLRRALLPSPQCELPQDCRVPSGYIR